MTEQSGQMPGDAEFERPSPARMYDYFLGGSHNFAADRELAEKYMRVLPDMPEISRANRRFLGRAVRYLAGPAGVDQFLDLGSGLPTQGSSHETARRLNPSARVVYVDVDPVTVEFGRTLLEDTKGVEMLHADLRDPRAILRSDEVRGTLDFSRPVAVLMVAMLHFVPAADDPAALVAAYRAATAPDSYLVVSHATSDYHPATMSEAAQVYNSAAAQGMNFRSRAQVAALLAGYDLLPPGLVDVIHWRPDPGDSDPFNGDVTRYNLLAAVGRRTEDPSA
ncbi:MAG TPA: SAM-dependent methyltransferase [Actinocrinis sp.]|nr:SAM-dependent methyltransferase [Actinocrinis sp.]